MRLSLLLLVLVLTVLGIMWYQRQQAVRQLQSTVHLDTGLLVIIIATFLILTAILIFNVDYGYFLKTSEIRAAS